MEVTQTEYHDMPSKTTGHRPLEVQLKVLQDPQTLSYNTDHDEQSFISPADEHDTDTWMVYYRTSDRILGHQANRGLNLAMRQAAAACGLHQKNHDEHEATKPHRDLGSIASAIWRDKRDLHTATHSQDAHSQQKSQRIAVRLEAMRRQLREWHERRAKDLAQEQQRYVQNPKPYKSLKPVDKVLVETGH